jgi:hypothetical protein
MTEVLTALERLSKGVTKLTSVVTAVRTKLVPVSKVERIARSIADTYFGSIASRLAAVQNRADLCDEIEYVLGAIMQLTTAPREKTAYLGHVAELRPYLQEAMIDVMRARGLPRLVLSETERSIVATLERMRPATAASYQQVLEDIAERERVSWRGTATELREVLREVMDHLAPDGDVMAAPGFKLEPDLKRPTQKQKVRFILKARRRAVATAEAAVETVEEGVAALARSAYQRGSAGAHASTDAAEVRKLKNYVDALLVELLEIGDA